MSLFLIVFLLSACGSSGSGNGEVTYSIGGTISGLSGTVVLQNNDADDLTLTANGTFTFQTELDDGDAYAVTVLTQPAGLTCSVSNRTGTVSGADITNVSVVCSSETFTVGGTISGLSGTVVLQNNSGDDLTVTENGSFTFSTAVADGAGYDITIPTQSSTQTCSLLNGEGTIDGEDVENVSITCSTNTYTVGGTISGLSGTVVLQNNVADDLTVDEDGSFTFATELADEASYSVTVSSQPSNQTCTVSSGSGALSGADITGVAVTCTNLIFMFSAAITDGNLGGRAGADTLCDGAKGTLSCPTSVRALICVSASDEIRDMGPTPMLYNVPTSLSVVSTNRTQLADDWTDLLDGSIDTTLLSAGVVTTGSFVTGCGNGGELSTDQHCEGWTSSSSGDNGRTGQISSANNWIDASSNTACNTATRILCLCY